MLRLVLIALLGMHLTSADFFLYKTLFEHLEDSLTNKCLRQIAEARGNFSTSTDSWALQMMDASSKVPSGIMDLNFIEMGDFDQCVQISASTTMHGVILGKYCLGHVSFGRKPHLNTTFSPGSLVNTTPVSLTPTWSLCLPDGCTTKDANVIGKALLYPLWPEVELTVNFTDLLCQTINEVNPEWSAGAITTIFFFSLLTLMIVLCSSYDMFARFYARNSGPIIIRGFSVYTNGMKIFNITNPTPDHFPCLNGLKFFSMMWVVAGHQFSSPTLGSANNIKYLMKWGDNLYSMFLVSGTLAVDTFFTVCGTLMVYGFMKAKRENYNFNIFLYYLHRYLRLTTPLAVVVLFSATLLKYTGSGPQWPLLIHYFQDHCVNYWWSALLYIQNYANHAQMCVGQTWYLNIDMQLYLISPLVFFALWKYPKFTPPILALCCVVLISMTFSISWNNNLSAIISNLYSNNTDVFHKKYYLVTHTRCTPWIIGIILGYYLFLIKQRRINFRISSKRTILVLWIICFCTLVTCVFSGHSTLRSKEYNRWGNALHIALVRPCWSLAIAWIILACTNNYGGPVNWILSLPIFQVFNRFTYGIYLTHVTLLYAMQYGRKRPEYFTTFNMAYQFWGTLSLSTGLATLLVFLTESPIIVLEKILRGAFVTKRNSPDEEVPRRLALYTSSDA